MPIKWSIILTLQLIARGLTKNRILMLDILANFDWKRPIYFTGGANDDGEYIWLKDYLQLDGLAFKLVPIKTPMIEVDAAGIKLESAICLIWDE